GHRHPAAQLRHARAGACLRPRRGVPRRPRRRPARARGALRGGDRRRLGRARRGRPAMTGWQLQLALLRRRNQGLLPLFALLALLLALYAVQFPGILSFTGIAKLSQSWLPLALVAMAQSLVMLTGGIDLTVGAMVSLGSVLAATLVGDSVAG